MHDPISFYMKLLTDKQTHTQSLGKHSLFGGGTDGTLVKLTHTGVPRGCSSG